MSYYHQNLDYNIYAYEYGDNGNHSNDEYKYKYDSYLDHYKPDTYEPNHNEPYPDHFEPDHCNYECDNTSPAEYGNDPKSSSMSKAELTEQVTSTGSSRTMEMG